MPAITKVKDVAGDNAPHRRLQSAKQRGGTEIGELLAKHAAKGRPIVDLLREHGAKECS